MSHKILYCTLVFLLFFPDLSSFALFKMALNVSVDMRVETWIFIGDSLAVKKMENDLQSQFTKPKVGHDFDLINSTRVTSHVE